jgi:hypothetical protein
MMAITTSNSINVNARRPGRRRCNDAERALMVVEDSGTQNSGQLQISWKLACILCAESFAEWLHSICGTKRLYFIPELHHAALFANGKGNAYYGEHEPDSIMTKSRPAACHRRVIRLVCANSLLLP